MRIISLLPSATEIICALGLEESLVGVTHECDYPPSVKLLPKVTHTVISQAATSAEIDAMVRQRLKERIALYSLDFPALECLAPDILVTQALCDVCAVSEAEVSDAACRLPGRPKVLNLEPMSLEDVFSTLLVVSDATGTETAAGRVVDELRARVLEVKHRADLIPALARPRVAFIEWIDPIFNGGHWNPALVSLAGGLDVLGSEGEASRTTSWQRLVDSQPDVMFISCCGFTAERAMLDLPILQAQPGWADLPCVRGNRVYVTDGNAYFSRPGPRLVDGLEILAHALHPGEFQLSSHLTPAIRVHSV